MSFSEGNADFKWGNVSSLNPKGIRLYNSCTYKGVKYFLYDCICTLHMRSTDTSIGKIVKMWENPQGIKKMRVIWFFRPKDVVSFLNVEPKWNEIFLACGKGEGLSDAVEVEKVHKKCNVICKSVDKRNPQASDSAIAASDYWFSSTFDVGTSRVSKRFPDHIDNVRIEVFFNRRSQDHVCNILQNREFRSDNSGFTKSNTRVTDSRTGALLKVSENPKNALYKQDHARAVNPSSIIETMSEKDGSQRTSRLPGDARPTTSVADKPLKKRVLNHSVHSGEEDMALPVWKRNKQDCANVSVAPSIQKEYKRDPPNTSSASTFNREVSRGGDTVCMMVQPGRGWQISGNKVIEVTRKPIGDGKKWFLDEPWEDRLQSAYEEGNLVFLTNLDPSYTSSDVEDIIWSTFRENADAKIIPRVTDSGTHYGQAFVIFRTQDTATSVISELASRNLVQVEGRLVVAFRKKPLKTSKSCSFLGHLVISDPKLKKKEAQRNAVSTSHAAQDNTIEYEFSVEWRILQEKSDIKWKRLNQDQDEERKELEKKVKDANLSKTNS